MTGNEEPNNQYLDERGQGFRLAGFSIRYPVTICMILISFLVLGGVSIFKIPLVMLPDVDAPFVMVRVPYFNATPDQIEEEITKPLEEALSTIPNIQRLTSYSNPNDAFIQMHFNWGEDIELRRAEVRERVEQVRKDLPEDVDNIYVMTWNTNEIPIMEGRISSGRDLRGAYDFLDLKIKKPLERVPGVGEVSINGVERKEINIYLRLDEIKRYRVDVDALFRQLEGSNVDVSLGRVVEGGYRFGVLAKGSVTSLEEIENFPVNNLGLKLKDVAEIEYGDPLINFGRHLNGGYAIALEIRKTSDANTVETVKRVMQKIEELNQDPSLEGIQVMVWHNAGEQITKSLMGLLNAGTVGAMLSVAVLYCFLWRLGATLAIGFAIPFSIISAIGFLYLLGNTLNILSMMGLMLSTGMLVDNAVVVLESIYQKLEKGYDRVKAASQGTQEVMTAVLASTLTSIIIFVPLVFGKTTEYSIWLSHTGIAIMITLVCSLFVSLTLIPLGVARFIHIDVTKQPRLKPLVLGAIKRPLFLLGRLPFFPRTAARLRSRTRERADSFKTGEAEEVNGSEAPPVKKPVTEHYLRLVRWHIRHRYVMGLLVVPLIIAVSFFVLTKLPDNSAEAEDLSDLAIQFEFSENYHYLKIEKEYVEPVENYLLANKDRFKIKNIYSFYGNNEATTRLFFDEERITLDELKDIRKQISDGLPVIPGADIRTGRQEGAEAENWIGVNFYGDDSVTLQGLANEARRRLKLNPDFLEVHTALEKGREEVQITLDREVARRFGVSPESVGGVLGIVLRGRELGGYRTDDGEVRIWMRLQQGDREDLNDLKSMVVGIGRDGQEILLSQVAGFELKKTPGSIERENRRTFTSLYANYSGAKKDEGKKLVTEAMESLSFPPGYGWSYGFWTQREEQEDNDFMFNLLLALFMVYFVMASLFESLAHPFAIMLSLLFAMVGVAWFLLITGTPFNIMAMIGIMILIGIVVNNGIVLIDHVNNLRRRGLPRYRAIEEGCRERFRPILMTATTTVVGLIPLAAGTSSMLGLRYFPMARTVMGGLMASTVLTLIVLPTYYTLVDDVSMWLRRVWHRSSIPIAHLMELNPMA
ncbi:MAG TPA: efflux RND transporter permease subunit, partial [Acidobacteriota bacterium]|nr:efflux RND transporter permease subunit [Acidobacteriota bacterium]